MIDETKNEPAVLTLEVPAAAWRKLKAAAEERGQTVEQLARLLLDEGTRHIRQ